TQSGARALRWDDRLGSFEKGKQPGLTLLDLENGNSTRIA
ncbi:MAG: hypothetical protein EBR98_01175, partial [Chitinophagaceae bacterium]|nr:hypothetical protein [Chitinophagaceae bacterium]